jgi:leucyl/phenylalanyl-tRNA--protein transferase
VALSFLVRACPDLGVSLIDCQMASRHLASLGARSLPRAEFLQRITSLVDEKRPQWTASGSSSPPKTHLD